MFINEALVNLDLFCLLLTYLITCVLRPKLGSVHHSALSTYSASHTVFANYFISYTSLVLSAEVHVYSVDYIVRFTPFVIFACAN